MFNGSLWWQTRWSPNLTQALTLINRSRKIQADDLNESAEAVLQALNHIWMDYSTSTACFMEETQDSENTGAVNTGAMNTGAEGPELIAGAQEGLALQDVSMAIDEIIEMVFDYPSRRLAAYGTLRPGESNHHIVSHIQGEWKEGTIHGELGEAHGYPVFKWTEGGQAIPVQILCSDSLPEEYGHIDNFEGVHYKRTLVPVLTGTGRYTVCNVYEGA